MKNVTVLVAALLLVACATNGSKDDEPPSLVPPPAVPATSAPVTDARLTELQTSMTELLERIDVLNLRIARLEASQAPEQRSSMSETRPASSAAAERPAAPTVNPRTSDIPPASPVEKRPPARASEGGTRALQSAAIADNYRSGLMLFGKGRLVEARTTFQQVFDAEPTGELADNALYWMGETYFAAGDYPSAMRYYERVTREYADQNKAPDALFKTGITFEKTGDLGMARKTFEDCIRRYPYSTSAASARLELKRIRY